MTNIKRRLLLTQSDERLVCLVQAGHEGAFEALVHRYRRPLLGYCRRLCSCEARAEEALQQALLNAWVALRRQTEVHDLRAWLYRVAHNAALNCMRSEQTARLADLQHAEQLDVLPGAVAQPTSIEDSMALREVFAGIAALPELQREVMLRTALGGHTHDEVACALGISDDAVRGLLYRARTALRAGLTALTPAPVLAWAARGAERGAGSGGQRVVELATGGGTAGLAGIVAKGSAVAITAGVAITGALVVHHRHALAMHQGPFKVLRESAQAGSVAGAIRGPVAFAVGSADARAVANARSGTHGSAGGAAQAFHGFGKRRQGARTALTATESPPTARVGPPAHDHAGYPGWSSPAGREGEGSSQPAPTAPDGQSTPTRLEASGGSKEDGWQPGTQADHGEAEGGAVAGQAGSDGISSQEGSQSSEGGEEDSGREANQSALLSSQAKPNEGHDHGESPEASD